MFTLLYEIIHSKGEIHNPANIGVVIIGYLLLESLFFAILRCVSSDKFEPINTATENYFRNRNEATNIVTIEL